eukprot:scaffold266382_cov30-Tisochrysis_lutea.AAC.8
MAQDQSEPAQTWTALLPLMAGTARGTDSPASDGASEMEGRPSAPCLRQPQASTSPAMEIASECRSPAAAARTSVVASAVTSVGDERDSKVPSPSSPCRPQPNAHSPP